MHIADGILPLSACAAAHAALWPAVWWTGRDAEPQEIVRLGVVSSALFAVSLVHVPLGGASVHFGLYGLAGILAGRRLPLALAAALLLQALLFQHGGLLTMGVNTWNMLAGGWLALLAWQRLPGPAGLRAGLAGAAGVMIPALLAAAELQLAGYGRGFWAVAGFYLPVALAEGVFAAAAVRFLLRSGGLAEHARQV